MKTMRMDENHCGQVTPPAESKRDRGAREYLHVYKHESQELSELSDIYTFCLDWTDTQSGEQIVLDVHVESDAFIIIILNANKK